MTEKSNSILKIHASTTDKIGNKLLYQYVVEKAQEAGIAGATVQRGIMGYGSSCRISSSKFWELTEKLPIVIELIDENEKLEAFYEHLKPDLVGMPKGCLVLLEPIQILLNKKGI
ncbi:MAG: hypothetical protein CSA96_05555 [Bacteroidetes bacterium]|nr:MAG: hypothetical protein CSA96_05555 [Bacteroidota bacterium]